MDMYKENLCANAVLKCNGREFNVNKGYLALVSDFFWGLFLTQEHVFVFDQLDVHMVDLVLTYIHGGDVEFRRDELHKILLVADTWGLKDLEKKLVKRVGK